MKTILQLTVRNQPGTMSHVMGLFTRRAYNVDAILCVPMDDPLRSRIWLRVSEDKCLQQIMVQLSKLADVLEVGRHAADPAIFHALARPFEEGVAGERSAGP